MMSRNFVAKYAKMSGAGQHKDKYGKNVSRARATQLARKLIDDATKNTMLARKA
jgi:hypothetical protein